MSPIGLETSQRQLLKLNANMFQSLEMMTLPLPELLERIKKELEENPTLAVEKGALNEDSYEEYASKQLRNEAHELSYSDSSAYGSDISDSHQAWLEGTITSEETLQEHLMLQLGCLKLDEKTRRAAETIISDLDSSGFFSHPLDEILTGELKEYKDEALEALHTLEPAGVAATDYKESLCLQAKDRGLEGKALKAFKEMVYEALFLLKQDKVKEASRIMGTDEEETKSLFALLKTLTPYPGARFSSGPEKIVIPDLSIKQEDGKLVLRMNDSTLPVLSIDAEYKKMAEEYTKAKSKDE
ncbi:MAG: RNA polymerase sigma-54 factor, partial [Sphaerochaetaceae bacterium]|nr:RNA polymerase sigma-54 factor [Sphaerochaetaceae bacterium]